MALTDDRGSIDENFAVSALMSANGDGLALVRDARRLPTAMEPLDRMLGGGFRLGDMVLLGGRPGVGKTILALQWARAMAKSGAVAVMASYEHDEQTLLGRLIALELGMLELGDAGNDLEAIVTEVLNGRWDAGSDVGRQPLVRAAIAQVESYSSRLVLLPAARLRIDLPRLEELYEAIPAERKALLIDYVQKVPIPGSASSWDAEGARVVAERMKELALSTSSVVIAVAAVDEAGLMSRRVRVQHLRSAAALSYEADIAIMLNDKALATSKVHLAYDLTKIQDFESRMVFSIEKNRSGRSSIDLEFEKDFARFRFAPDGGFVAETLIDGVVVDA